MTTSNDTGRGDDGYEFDKSDQEWFDALTGRMRPATDADAVREGNALRRAILLERERERNAPVSPTEAAEEEQGLQQLMFRLRRERLVGPSLARRWTPAIGLAAAVLMAVVLFDPFHRDDTTAYYDEPPILRGPADTPSVLIDAKPKERADTLAAQLKARGVTVNQYQKGHSFFVYVEVPPEQLDSVRDALSQAGIEAKAGLTRIEIKKH